MNAVEADNISKSYRVYLKPVDRLKEALLRRSFHQAVTSLHDVSFNVPVGETLGIIGENGAGKSTLLKVLAGTTEPSSGQLKRKGRVAALLELGSGFHPEFSGRANIHLNAALLGLTEKEISEREAPIIEFSELQDVIERPVKTYSSGMYVRLAFSIATSVDPDVLIIDEALSVGDQRFQQKCVERMVGFRNSGKTIIVCSHSMYMINELCAKTIWLNHGRISGYGKTSDVISKYLAFLENRDVSNPEKQVVSAGGQIPEVIIDAVTFCDQSGREVSFARQFCPLKIKISARSTMGEYAGHMGIGLERADGQMIFVTTTKHQGLEPVRFSGQKQIEVTIPSFPILKGAYRAKGIAADEHGLRVIYECYSDPILIESDYPELGMVWIEHQWNY